MSTFTLHHPPIPSTKLEQPHYIRGSTLTALEIRNPLNQPTDTIPIQHTKKILILPFKQSIRIPPPTPTPDPPPNRLLPPRLRQE
jgi:hypothetical protein